ncbi:MAG: hypothetical protein K0R50_2930 [Eubacterium sp.]|jgi:hypothetical protein|nr:hypothetical protein [Eubacterium sp.]
MKKLISFALILTLLSIFTLGSFAENSNEYENLLRNTMYKQYPKMKSLME